MTNEDTATLGDKMLCYSCVGEEYLREKIQQIGVSSYCSYCGNKAEAISVEEMADRIEQAFESHYARTSDQPEGWQQSLISDRESDYDWYRDGDPVIDALSGAAVIEEEIARDIQEVLDDRHGDMESASMGEETEFSGETYYEERATSDRTWQEAWRTFERSLRTEARFFSRTAAAHLSTVFNGIADLATTMGHPLVVDAGPGTALTSFYRARVFQADGLLEDALCRPDQQLGPPPARLAAAGRMNARGISVFYGSTDPKAAIAEVRPPVGSKVAVARFDLIRAVRLLDLTAFSDVVDGGSIFDPESVRRMERAMFLRSLSDRMTRPVMPDDEAFAYLATQAVADFLATEAEPALDGILFRSVQVSDGKLNVVLFHKSAKVQALDIPSGATIRAGSTSVDDDGPYPDYRVVEEVPLPTVDERSADPFAQHHSWDPDDDWRDATLRVALDTVKLHHLQRVEFFTDEYDVDRSRHEKSKFEF
jgi:hypothetical protein